MVYSEAMMVLIESGVSENLDTILLSKACNIENYIYF